jgi:hypothetical protein
MQAAKDAADREIKKAHIKLLEARGIVRKAFKKKKDYSKTHKIIVRAEQLVARKGKKKLPRGTRKNYTPSPTSPVMSDAVIGLFKKAQLSLMEANEILVNNARIIANNNLPRKLRTNTRKMEEITEMLEKISSPMKEVLVNQGQRGVQPMMIRENYYTSSPPRPPTYNPPPNAISEHLAMPGNSADSLARMINSALQEKQEMERERVMIGESSSTRGLSKMSNLNQHMLSMARRRQTPKDPPIQDLGLLGDDEMGNMEAEIMAENMKKKPGISQGEHKSSSPQRTSVRRSILDSQPSGRELKYGVSAPTAFGSQKKKKKKKKKRKIRKTTKRRKKGGRKRRTRGKRR